MKIRNILSMGAFSACGALFGFDLTSSPELQTNTAPVTISITGKIGKPLPSANEWLVVPKARSTYVAPAKPTKTGVIAPGAPRKYIPIYLEPGATLALGADAGTVVLVPAGKNIRHSGVLLLPALDSVEGHWLRM